MVARGEAVNSEEELAALSKPAAVAEVVVLKEDRDDDPRTGSPAKEHRSSGSLPTVGSDR
jgi:hypothetical protein